jgi:DNA topoisomerase-1
MDLIIIESPNKIKKLRQILGSGYLILPTVGHFRDLPKRDLGVDLTTFEAAYEVDGGKSRVVDEMLDAAKKAGKIYLASDPDREGEAISWHVAEVLQLKDPLRAEFHEITKAAVTKAINNPRKLNMALVEAQQSRRILDRLVGYILSPELRPLGKGLSAGRVQSCVLHLICKRELEREQFVVRKYWTISVDYKNGLTAGAANVSDDGKLKLIQFEAEEDARSVVEKLEKARHIVQSVEGSEVERRPKPPFETSSLLKAGGIAFGWKADKTTKVAQELFESGLITYPRTDSLNVAAEAQETARRVLAERFPDALPAKPPVFKSKGDAQEAHECIRPSHPEDEAPNGMSADQAELYRIIWKRFLASQAKSAMFAKTLVTIDADGTTLRAIGMLLTSSGFLAIGDVAEDDNENEEGQIPEVKTGDALVVKKIDSAAKKTSPPPRYKEATLIEEMKRLGVGRPSTYSSTLKVLFAREYIQQESRKKNPALLPTELGKTVDDFLLKGFAEVLEPTYTAAMEDSLDRIAESKQNRVAYLQTWFADFSTKLLAAQKIWNSSRQLIGIAAESGPPCPICQAATRKRAGKFGAFWGCTRYPECKGLLNVNPRPAVDPKEMGPAPACPRCGGAMVGRSSKKGPFWGCGTYPKCKGTVDAATPKSAPIPRSADDAAGRSRPS